MPMRSYPRLFYFLILTVLQLACSPSARIKHSAREQLLLHPSFQPAHVGISIFDVESGKFWYNHQADKYFVPASNTKLFTCLAALQTLGDSLVAFRWVDKGAGSVEAEANGDPTFLHPDFLQQPAFDWLKKQQKIVLTDQNWKDKGLGAGWAWDDYTSDYTAERSFMPLYGNLVNFQLQSSLFQGCFSVYLMQIEWKHHRVKRQLLQPLYHFLVLQPRIGGLWLLCLWQIKRCLYLF